MPKNQIIVALDVPTLNQAIALVELLPEVTFYKVGLELFTSVGHEIIKYLQSQGKRIFLDLKLHDIPNTVAATCRVLSHLGVDFITVHAMGGGEMLAAAQQGLAGSATQLLAVTVLTSISSDYLRSQLKITIDLPDYALGLATLAQNCGLAGCICSPQELTTMRSHLSPNFCLVTPGIRSEGTELQDQSRVMSPQQALALGANYLVIGRPITAAANPTQMWHQICEQICT